MAPPNRISRAPLPSTFCLFYFQIVSPCEHSFFSHLPPLLIAPPVRNAPTTAHSPSSGPAPTPCPPNLPTNPASAAARPPRRSAHLTPTLLPTPPHHTPHPEVPQGSHSDWCPSHSRPTSYTTNSWAPRIRDRPSSRTRTHYAPAKARALRSTPSTRRTPARSVSSSGTTSSSLPGPSVRSVIPSVPEPLRSC